MITACELRQTAIFLNFTFYKIIKAMVAQYTYDANGNPIGVFIPIHDWNRISESYPGIEDIPEWEKKLIDQRLDFIKQHPEQLIPIEDFLAELDIDDEL
jgi:hypothetical protein